MSHKILFNLYILAIPLLHFFKFTKAQVSNLTENIQSFKLDFGSDCESNS